MHNSELGVILDRTTEALDQWTAISSIIYNNHRNISEDMARKCIHTIIEAGADVDIPDARGMIL